MRFIYYLFVKKKLFEYNFFRFFFYYGYIIYCSLMVCYIFEYYMIWLICVGFLFRNFGMFVVKFEEFILEIEIFVELFRYS